MSEQKFEDKLSKLEEIVLKLEKGEVNLETAMGMFTDGTKLVKELQTELQAAEKNITNIVQNDGSEVNFNSEGE